MNNNHAENWKDSEQLINEVNTDMMEYQLRVVKHIYVDLAAMKDTRLGLMIGLCETEEQLKYLENGLTAYNQRLTRSFTEKYPEFKYTESELERMYKEITYQHVAFNHAPDTDFFNLFTNLIHLTLHNNAKQNYYYPIKVTINLYPFKMQTSIVTMWSNFLSRSIPREQAVLTFISLPYEEIIEREWVDMDMYILDELQKAVLSPLGNHLFVENAKCSKIMYAPYQVSDDIFKIWLSEGLDVTDTQAVSNRFALTHTTFNVFCDFTYVKFNILT